MLLTTITSLPDLGVAEAMREIARKRHCDAILTEQAVDLAVRAYQCNGGDRGRAINEGVALIVECLDADGSSIARNSRRRSDNVTNLLDSLPGSAPQPAAWVQGDGFAIGCLAVVAVWFVAVAFGWTL